MSSTLLVILDGYGYSKNTTDNAIFFAHKPTLDRLIREYPHTLLEASGKAVGLLDHMVGNSQVGHLTIGAGRVIPQAITRIHVAIEKGTFFTNPLLTDALSTLASSNHALHILGLVSDGGVHSHINHLFAFLKAAHQAHIKKIYIHAFLDGRDVAPKSAAHLLEQLDRACAEYGALLASISGRFYAMDRGGNWERTEKVYDILTGPHPTNFSSWRDALDYYYSKGITDEFIPPTVLNTDGIIHDHDGIIFFNFRPDRARQLTASFMQKNFTHFRTKHLKLAFFITPTDYHSYDFETLVLFPDHPIENTLKDVLLRSGKTFFAIAETEKYAHVTYFFSGGKEAPYPNETRTMIPSRPDKRYDQHPEMSAAAITKAVIDSLEKNPQDFYLINYANADMVGHSGNLQATIKAIECLDTQIAQLYDTVIKKMNGTLYITADHGKAEEMYDEKTNQPRTAHTNNPVPFIMVRKDLKDKDIKLPLKQLADIAPFIIKNF